MYVFPRPGRVKYQSNVKGGLDPSRTRIYINPPPRCPRGGDRARRPKTILFMRATDGPGVNVMILLTGYGCLPKSISGGKLRDEFCGRKRARTSEKGGRETKGTKAATRLVSLSPPRLARHPSSACGPLTGHLALPGSRATCPRCPWHHGRWDGHV